MKDVNALRQKRGQLIEACRKILDKADAEKRKLTAEEEQEFNRMDREVDELGKEVEREERQQNLEADMARSQRDKARSIGGDGKAELNADVEEASAVLKPKDSMTRHLESRGLLKQMEFRDLTFGALMRSMVLGPKSDLERRALAEGSDSAGGVTVPDITLARFVDKLRAATVTIRAGAQTVPLTSDKTTIARTATDPVAQWRAENAAVAESDPTFEGIVLVPRSLGVIVKVSRELVEDSVNIEDALTAAFLGALSVELDRVAAHRQRRGTAAQRHLPYKRSGFRQHGYQRRRDRGLRQDRGHDLRMLGRQQRSDQRGRYASTHSGDDQ